MEPAQTTISPSTELVRGEVYFFSRAKLPPVLEIKFDRSHLNDVTQRVPFAQANHGRIHGETLWKAEPLIPAQQEWQFRIELTHGTYAAPDKSGSFDYYSTSGCKIWLQNGQVYNYQPAAAHSMARVVKIPHFTGSLSKRALYVYLPRGYDQHTFKKYPLLYMHDGQNCFEGFVGDSYSGSWRADEVATKLIAQGQMEECIIVGVSNGGHERIAEYLPPYAEYHPFSNEEEDQLSPIRGRADRTYAYYANEVAPFLKQYYRVLDGRENTAVCGSSMGGLFSSYIAWEHSEFAYSYGAMSPSFWITRTDPLNLNSPMAIVERFRNRSPRPLRLWLDTGTLDGQTYGDDGKHETAYARDILQENGYVEGDDFRYYLDEGAVHHESAWAARLDKVFKFLFPLRA
ncbi:MAG: alpha/beta hydrolase [Anaerolineales bacterium]|nr:alpha/beta hydrolase [Anaerolineales bacterium]